MRPRPLMLLASAPENYAQPQSNMDPAQSGWQGGSGWLSTDMYHEAWYSQSESNNWGTEQLQQILQQPGFEMDQPAMGPTAVLWPSGAGQRDGWADNWQGKQRAESLWYQATAMSATSATSGFGGPVSYDASSRPCIMSTAPIPPPKEPEKPKRTAIAKKEAPVDEEFERDVAKAVMEFLEGGDLSDEEEDDLGSLPGVPNRTPAPLKTEVDAGASGRPELEKLKKLKRDFVTGLQTLFPEPSGGTAVHEEAVKLLELLAKSEKTETQNDNSRVAPTSSPKHSLQLEELVCSSTRSRPLEPELQKGQWIGVMLKNLPLPVGVTALHMALLRPKVEAAIKFLIQGGTPSSLSNITICLRKEGIGEPLTQAIWNLCPMFPSTFCLWVPDEGEMSLMLLEKPLPPVEDEVADQLHHHLAAQWKKLQVRTSTTLELSTKLPEQQGQGSNDLAQDLAAKGVTTVMIKNLPTSLQQGQVLEELNRSGFQGRYDFFYMPGVFGSNKSLGYAFLNLVSVEAMKELTQAFHNSQRFGATDTLKIGAAAVQGREANAQKYEPRMRRIRNPTLRPWILEPTRPEAETRPDAA